MPIKLANNATSTIATAINASDVGVVLATGDGAKFPTLAAREYFYITFESTGGTYEIAKATARVGDSLTIVRAQEGTTAQSFAAGSRAELRVTAQSIKDISDIVSVKSFGAVGDGVTNDTSALQACFNYAAGVATVYVPAGIYMVDAVTVQSGQTRGGLYVPSNSHIIMDVSTIIRAIPNNTDSYNVLLINNATNVIVENGTVQGDRATHIDSGVYGAYCVAIWGSNDVFIKNVTARDSYTDGFVILYNDLVAPYPESTNVHLINCTADNNYRNGASIIGCIGGSIIGGRYINSNGTAPQDGIDLEPNANNGSGGPSTVSNFVIQGVQAYGNAVTGIEVFGAGTVELLMF
jgi:polygalacturonase